MVLYREKLGKSATQLLYGSPQHGACGFKKIEISRDGKSHCNSLLSRGLANYSHVLLSKQHRTLKA